MTDKTKHIHKLKMIKYKTGNKVFFCSLDCTFKISVQLALGKRSICWRCNEPFIMTEYSLRLVKPHCPQCHQSKDKKEIIESNNDISAAQGVAQNITEQNLTLAEKLNQIIQQTQQKEEEEAL